MFVDFIVNFFQDETNIKKAPRGGAVDHFLAGGCGLALYW